MLGVQESNTMSLRCQLEEIMNNVGKKKKTRRGKKKCSKCRVAEGELQSEVTSTVNQQKIKNRNLLRPPASPRAPFNSTQFIMDDKTVDMDQFVNMSSPDEFLLNRSGFVEASSSCLSSPDTDGDVSADSMVTTPTFSFNSQDRNSIDQCVEEEVYEPMWINEDEYMGLDFERQFYSQMEIKEQESDKLVKLRALSRAEIIQRYCKLEKRHNSVQKRMKRSSHKGRTTKVKLEALKAENSELKVENERLKKLIQTTNL